MLYFEEEEEVREEVEEDYHQTRITTKECRQQQKQSKTPILETLNFLTDADLITKTKLIYFFIFFI